MAAAPLLTLMALLGGLQTRSHLAALAGLASALALATTEFHLPFGHAASGALEGAAFGLFPITWIILNAVWINTLQRSSKYFDVIARTFSSISNDIRIQTILIAFCFGAMIESMSGFGTPIAVTSVLLVGLGLTPIRAATITVFANTAPGAFGSAGNPIQALAKVTSLEPAELAVVIGRQSAVIAIIVPVVLVILLDGIRGLRQLWPVALTAGVAFGAGQLLCSAFLTYQLTDLVAATMSTLAVIAFIRMWKPKHALDASIQTAQVERDSIHDVLIAFTPYLTLAALFASTTLPGPIHRALDAAGTSFRWPGISPADASGSPLSITVFDLPLLSSSGTVVLMAGVFTAFVLRTSPRDAVRSYRDAALQIRWTAITITSVLALSYVMTLSGMTSDLGAWAAGAGSAFPLLSGLLGWFGVALTGSDTSSNILFGAVQVSAAHDIGVSPLLMAATNSTGGVQGKAVAMQNLALAAGAVGLHGREGQILRKVIGWSIGLLSLLCIATWLLTLK